MRGVQYTVCAVLVVAMLVTATQAAPQTAAASLVDAPCPDAPSAFNAAQDMTRRRLQKRFGFIGGLFKAATGFVSKAFGRGAAKVAPVADDAAGALTKNVADDAAGALTKNVADDAAAAATKKAAEKAAAKEAADLAKKQADEAAKAARIAASKTGGFAGFAARTGLTKSKIFKEIAITVVATAALNKVFNSLTEKKQKESLEEQTKNAVIAADLANRGELTQEEAEKLGVFFDPEAGILELPPGVTIPPPAGAQSVAFADVVPADARPGAVGATDADPEGSPAVAPPPDPALIAEQTKNTTIALELAANKQLTKEKAAELGLNFDPVAETLEVPEGVDLDALPEPVPGPNVAPPAGTAAPGVGTAARAAATAAPATAAPATGRKPDADAPDADEPAAEPAAEPITARPRHR